MPLIRDPTKGRWYNSLGTSQLTVTNKHGGGGCLSECAVCARHFYRANILEDDALAGRVERFQLERSVRCSHHLNIDAAVLLVMC